MGEKFPSQGLSINKHPVFNLSNYQQKWQAALTERTVVQRNIASLTEGFFNNHSSKIALLQAHFSGVNLFNGIAKACVEAFPVQVGDPTFRKAVMNLLNKTSKSGDDGERIPQLTEKEATEMMTTIIEYGKQYTQLHTERANVVKYNLLSLMLLLSSLSLLLLLSLSSLSLLLLSLSLLSSLMLLS